MTESQLYWQKSPAPYSSYYLNSLETYLYKFNFKIIATTEYVPHFEARTES